MSVTGSRQNTTAAAYAKSRTPTTMNDVPSRRDSLCMRATTPSYVKAPAAKDPPSAGSGDPPDGQRAELDPSRGDQHQGQRAAERQRAAGDEPKEPRNGPCRSDLARPGEQPQEQEEGHQADGHRAEPGDD